MLLEWKKSLLLNGLTLGLSIITLLSLSLFNSIFNALLVIQNTHHSSISDMDKAKPDPSGFEMITNFSVFGGQISCCLSQSSQYRHSIPVDLVVDNNMYIVKVNYVSYWTASRRNRSGARSLFILFKLLLLFNSSSSLTPRLFTDATDW